MHAKNPKLIDEIKGHSSEVRVLAFSPSGAVLVSVSANRGILIYQSEGLEEIETMAELKAVRAIIFLSESTIAVANDEVVLIWFIGRKEPELTIHQSKFPKCKVLSLALSPGGFQFASGDSNKFIRLYSTKTYNLISEINCNNLVQRLVFVSEFEIIAGIYQDAMIKVNMITKTKSLVYTKHNEPNGIGFYNAEGISFLIYLAQIHSLVSESLLNIITGDNDTKPTGTEIYSNPLKVCAIIINFPTFF